MSSEIKNQVIEQFAAECHDILKADTGPDGLEQVRQRLEKVLVDPTVIADYLGEDAEAPRNILYEDPELGFCIIAHIYKQASARNPHDHGPSWAIYGQVKGTTVMTEFELVEAPSDDAPGKAAPVKVYDLKPGMAVAYAPGVLHAPTRHEETRLIRIEGLDMERIRRDKYEAVEPAQPAQ
jgi:predicted metal-dependent enzyme (double-stranded beta helix superfamily)